MSECEFEGFGTEALPFLKALGFHQDRDWFHDNKALYESQLRRPLIALVETISHRFEQKGLPFRGARKSSLFRINRDIRFAKEKHPYNTHVSGVLTRDGTKKDTGGLYFQIGPEGSFMASGLWYPQGTKLRAFRELMIERAEEFFTLEDDLKSNGLKFGTESKLTRPPNGFKHVHDERLIERLKYKSFVVSQPLDEETLYSSKLLDEMEDFARIVVPFMQFVWRATDPLREEDGNA
ncbi:MAG: TIGR02453 family protein [Ahrensia sp.]|nr:TIGR02453 family protein [Ahrensia sp.]